MSKEIRDCFGFALLRSLISSKIIASPSQPIRCKTESISRPSYSRFPAPQASYVYLLWVLIDSLWYCHLFWFAAVITLVLVFTLYTLLHYPCYNSQWFHNVLRLPNEKDDQQALTTTTTTTTIFIYTLSCLIRHYKNIKNKIRVLAAWNNHRG